MACIFRTPLGRFLKTVNKRVEDGGPVEGEIAGLAVRLPEWSPQSPSGPEPQPGAQPLVDTELVPAESQPNSTRAAAAPQIYVAHTSRRDRSLDKGNYRYHRIRVFLEGDNRDLDRVTKVVYHLHPTFYEPERTVTGRAKNFELETSAWGMFNLTADVHLEDRQEPLRLGRYLNF
ncbi:hypothetical protein GCM10010344_61410 [Streptomyces bluensis]|nr:hypothetical protein GCM10010344_61410 [Streptomyces bluensis]